MEFRNRRRFFGRELESHSGGSTASIALSLALAAFGVGVGFSVVSPWSDSGVSGTTFSIAAGVYARAGTDIG